MSKTFAAKPSQQSTRGRGRTNPASSNSNLGRGVGRAASQADVHDRARSRRTFDSPVQTRGRGGVVRGRSTGVTNPRGPQEKRMHQQPELAASGPRCGRGTGNLNYADYAASENLPGIGRGQMNSPSRSETTQPSLEQRGQYAGSYTVFAPNERRRQQINQMAQREIQDYERFKQANSGQTFNYVGTLGGGEMGQDQVRNRQANAVRAQKFNRQMRQNAMREERKRTEEQEIDAKRAHARQKAEENRMRGDRVVPAEEVRRKREAFLQQFEAASINQASTSAQSSNEAPRSSQRSSMTQVSPGSRPNNSSRLFSTHFSQRQTEVPDTLPQQEGVSSIAGLDILSNMFPSLHEDYLADLLLQMGSADSVIQLLNDD